MPSITNKQGEGCGVQQPKRRRKIHSANNHWKKQQWENIMKAKEDYFSTTGQKSHWPLVNQAQQEWLNAKEIQDWDLSSTADSNSMLSMSHRKAAMVPTWSHSCVATGGPPPNPHMQNTERPAVVSSTPGNGIQSSINNLKTQNGSVGQDPNLFSARFDSRLSYLRYAMRIAASTFERTPSIFRKRTRESFLSKGRGENGTYSQVDKSHLGAGNYGGKPEPKLLSSPVVEMNGSALTPSYLGASIGASSSTTATLSRATCKKASRLDCATPTPSSKAATPSSKAASSKKASSSSCATPSTTASQKALRSSSATPSRQMSTQSPETHLHQKIRSSNVSKQPFNQKKGTPKQKGLASNQRRSLSQIRRLSDVDERLPVPVGKIKSSFKGVGYFRRTKRWEAHIWNKEESKQEYLGAFYTEVQAARAYDRATLYFRGVNAKLHFKLEDYTEELPRLQALTKDQLTTMLKKQSRGGGRLLPAYPA